MEYMISEKSKCVVERNPTKTPEQTKFIQFIYCSNFFLNILSTIFIHGMTVMTTFAVFIFDNVMREKDYLICVCCV